VDQVRGKKRWEGRQVCNGNVNRSCRSDFAEFRSNFPLLVVHPNDPSAGPLDTHDLRLPEIVSGTLRDPETRVIHLIAHT